MTEPISGRISEKYRAPYRLPMKNAREYESAYSGAFFFPFNNGERAEVGTLYVQEDAPPPCSKACNWPVPDWSKWPAGAFEIACAEPGTATEQQRATPHKPTSSRILHLTPQETQLAAQETQPVAQAGQPASSAWQPAAQAGQPAAQETHPAVRGSLLLYCWRGGMRSQSVAWLMEKVGIHCFTLEKRVQGIPQPPSRLFEHLPHPINVLGGLTGSGKTERLFQMAAAGEQVIDLEGLANHKGSAFGNLGNPASTFHWTFSKPAVPAFSQMDPSRPVAGRWKPKRGPVQPSGRVRKNAAGPLFLLKLPGKNGSTALEGIRNVWSGFAETSILKIQKGWVWSMSKAVEACRSDIFKLRWRSAWHITINHTRTNWKHAKKNNGLHTFDTI